MYKVQLRCKTGSSVNLLSLLLVTFVFCSHSSVNSDSASNLNSLNELFKGLLLILFFLWWYLKIRGIIKGGLTVGTLYLASSQLSIWGTVQKNTGMVLLEVNTPNLHVLIIWQKKTQVCWIKIWGVKHSIFLQNKSLPVKAAVPRGSSAGKTLVPKRLCHTCSFWLN